MRQQRNRPFQCKQGRCEPAALQIFDPQHGLRPGIRLWVFGVNTLQKPDGAGVIARIGCVLCLFQQLPGFVGKRLAEQLDRDRLRRRCVRGMLNVGTGLETRFGTRLTNCNRYRECKSAGRSPGKFHDLLFGNEPAFPQFPGSYANQPAGREPRPVDQRSAAEVTRNSPH